MLLLLCRFAQSAAAVLLAGTAALRLFSIGTDIRPPGMWRWLTAVSWGALVAAAAGLLWLTASEMSGEPATWELIATVLGGTRFGAVWQLRMALLAIMPLALLLPDRPRPWAGAFLASAFLASLVLSGHADASPHRAWLLPAAMLHVVAAGLWPGGLLPFILLLRCARDQPPQALLRISRRFSNFSVAAVAILAFTAVLNGAGLIGASAAVWQSSYGRLAMAKAAIFGVMIALGAVNRRHVRAETGQLFRRLCVNVSVECALAVLVLLAAEGLAVTPPPR